LPDPHTEVPDVFVLMPFNEDQKPIFTTHISRVVKRLGLTVGRADNFFAAHRIMSDVWTAISRSRLLVADCSGRNANVFYELGIAHTIGKPVILLTRDSNDMPFDLQHLRSIEYTYTPPGMKAFEKKLDSSIRNVLSIPSKAAQKALAMKAKA
jgi:hypothetical protein